MSEEESTGTPIPLKRPRWQKKRWWSAFLLVTLLVWLDGPGWRWLGERAANHYLPDMGYAVDFELEGRLTSGPIRVVGLELSSENVVHEAKISGFEIRYSLLEAIKGQVRAIELNGAEIDINLAALPETEEPDEEKEPLDLEKTLSDIRTRLMPVEVDIRNFSIRIRRGQEPVFSLAPTNLHHAAGSSEFVAELGEMSLPQDRRIPAQSPTITWEPGTLKVDHLALLEEIALADVSASFGQPANYAGSLFIGKTRIDLITDLEMLRLSMIGPPMDFAEVERIAKITIPVDGVLSKLEAEIINFSGGIDAIDARATLSVSDFNYDEWRSESILVNAELTGDQAIAKLELSPAGSPVIVNARATLDRSKAFVPTNAEAELTLTEMARILTSVRDRYTPGEEQPSPPDGRLTLKTSADFDSGQPSGLEAVLAIIPNGDAPPLNVNAEWNPSEAIQAILEIPTLRVTASFDPDETTYEAKADFRDFKPDSLEPWLLPFGIEVPSEMVATLTWAGSGQISEATHQGDFTIPSFTWQNGDPDTNPIVKAQGQASYDWPELVKLETLKVGSGDQEVLLQAEMMNQTLRLKELQWSEGETSLATGSAEVPLPENPADWRALLKLERPIKVELKTPDLELSRLHRFLPETVRFPEASTGAVNIELGGTPTDPILDASVIATQVGLISQSEVPPTDFKFIAKARDKTLKLDGEINVPGYPKATISGATSWLPDQWAAEPATAKQAPLDAELRVTDLNLEPFQAKITGVRKLAGQIDLVAVVTGTVGEPKPTATVTLEGGSLDWHQAGKPDISDAALKLVITEEKATLEKLSLGISSGTLDGSGTVGLEGFKPTQIDLSFKGNALPVLRNDSMIVRLSPDLKLAGSWESAGLSGSIRVIDSLIYKDFEILPIGNPINPTAQPSMPSVDSSTPAEQLATIPEPFRNWGLDLSLKTDNPFLIRGNLAGGEIYLDAKLGGTVGKPRPTGGAKLREVTAQLPFSTLSIPAGTITFNPDRPFDPTLSLKGESTVRPYDIEIFIYGPVSNPKFQPTSNPPLPESEILTLIATGATTEGLANPSAATARAAQLVIEEMRRGRIGAVKSLRPIFKILDKVDFQVGESDAYSSKTFNSVTFNLDENWLLTAGISEEGYSRAKVTYLLRFR